MLWVTGAAGAGKSAAAWALWRRLGLSVDWSMTYTTIGKQAQRISQRAFLRMLERGEIPMTKPGRHRYVQLKDLVLYQESVQRRRREVLDAIRRPSPDPVLEDHAT